MQVSHSQPNDSASPTNGQSTLHDLFALTDEQILEIEPEAQEPSVARGPWSATREEKPDAQSRSGTPPAQSELGNKAAGEKPNIDSQTIATSSSTEHGTRSTEHGQEPPAWLAAQMKDPWSGEEARELWNGVQQARVEAAAYREVFAKPEDARALKEIYPGGASEARAAAERARVLDEIDRAYFGAAGTSPEQNSAARAQLAAMMLKEDPAAFREMVFAGLRALEKANVAPPGIHPGGVGRAASSTAGAQSEQKDAGLKPGATSPSPVVGAQHAAPLPGNTSANEAHVAAYAAFEKAANEELERSVGSAIERNLAQALPAAAKTDGAALGGRLSSAIRQEIENALRGDRQLGEQVAQILSGRRLDDEARGQVVRLIGERAQQLVPGAAKRVINEWTQTTFAAHRGKTARADAASTKREVAPASLPAGFSRDAGSQTGPDLNRGATRPRVDYRKLSDEQILEM